MSGKWTKRTMRMRDDHGWTAKPGNVVFVADRGAVIFEYPREWAFVPEGATAALYDKAPPDDECRLQMTLFHLPPGIDWSALPLGPMLADAVTGHVDPTATWGEIATEERPGLELAWTETRFVDKGEQRPARSRTCIARGGDVQCLITLDFWEDDAGRVVPVWDDVLETLRLGEKIADPTRGPRRKRR